MLYEVIAGSVVEEAFQVSVTVPSPAVASVRAGASGNGFELGVAVTMKDALLEIADVK